MTRNDLFLKCKDRRFIAVLENGLCCQSNVCYFKSFNFQLIEYFNRY
jgi:hypothetical protein